MAKIQFTLEAWLKDKSQKVEIRDGKHVATISVDMTRDDLRVCANFGNNRIVHYYNDGRFWKNANSDNDLFIVTPEEELTEFEKAIKRAFICAGRDSVSNDIIKDTAAELLELAKQELCESGEVTDWYAKGKAEALKDLPKWKKCTDVDRFDPYIIKPWIVRFDNNVITDSGIIHHGHYLCFADLEKLPKEDDSHE